MARLTRTRYQGAIPERQHDAFLLALLIAVSLNVGLFAIQALLPRISSLLRLLAPDQSEMLREEESYPFVLIDPSFLDEQLDPEQPVEAQAAINREARQAEPRPDLPEAFAAIDEGIDEILTAPVGNPGPTVSYLDAPGELIDEPAQSAQTSEGLPEEREETETRAPEASADPPEMRADPVEEQPQPEAPPPPPDIPPPEPAARPEPPPPEEIPPPEPEAAPQPVEEPVESEEPEAADPVSDIVDLAALPLSSEGFFDTEARRREEELWRRQLEERRRQAEQQPEITERPQPQPQQPTQQPARQGSRPPPPIRRIGGASSAGGAPPRRNSSTSVRLLDSDASMRLLAHRYGPYMQKLAEQLQASLLRQIILSPTTYSRGQVKVRFGISPDGALTYYDTIFPTDGSLVGERLLAEQTLREAAPFDPLTTEMQRDENFQKMTVIVTLY